MELDDAETNQLVADWIDWIDSVEAETSADIDARDRAWALQFPNKPTCRIYATGVCRICANAIANVHKIDDA